MAFGVPSSTRAAWALSLALSACSSAAVDPGSAGWGSQGGSAGESSGVTGDGRDGGATSSGNTSGSIASSSGSVSSGAPAPKYSDAAAGSLYDAPPPDASGQQVVTFTMDSFVVAPGAEVYKCQQLGNPFGKNVDFVYYEGHMSQGSHHFFLFNMDPSTNRTQKAPLADCPSKGLEFHPFPYLAQQPNWNVGYPEPGMAYPFVSSNGLMINVHYLNSGSSPITAQVSIKITLAAPGTVTTHVGNIMLNNTFFSVPANVPMSSPVAETKSTAPLPNAYSIFTSWSHMHRTSVKFTASANGSVFYTETNWDTPQLFKHTPYMQMKGGTSISWSCDYYNTTSQALAFGDSAINNVMCIYLGQYFPADPNNPDIVSVAN